MYILHEYSTEIYTRTFDGTVSYFYTAPALGEPHSASGINMSRTENIVAYAHSHPTGKEISGPDEDWANFFQVDAYLINPDRQLQRYDWQTGKTTPLGQLGQISPKLLSSRQKAYLISICQGSWENHVANLPCQHGYVCGMRSWPGS